MCWKKLPYWTKGAIFGLLLEVVGLLSLLATSGIDKIPPDSNLANFANSWIGMIIGQVIFTISLIIGLPYLAGQFFLGSTIANAMNLSCNNLGGCDSQVLRIIYIIAFPLYIIVGALIGLIIDLARKK